MVAQNMLRTCEGVEKTTAIDVKQIPLLHTYSEILYLTYLINP